MSSTDRQNRLLVAEDWKRVYQSFENADFQSYDFDNLRRTMISYLRQNYPEDFNDYIESSEYLALIDLIAFLGQNLSFRIDLNARENFLELAERRESVLRLARLLSYNPKRNQAANGLLKVESISTTEGVKDSNNINLAGQTVIWNDPSNNNWFEQFVKIINAAMPAKKSFGSPEKSTTIAGVPTELYRVNGSNTNVPVFAFDKFIQGVNTRFEIVSSNLTDLAIVEEPPLPGNNFAFMFRNDGQGPSSSNTGFFVHFRQGSLDQGQFSLLTPSTNQTVNIDTQNINNSDVWLYKLNSNNQPQTLWTKVDSVEGNNVIYNSLQKQIRSIYSVLTRVNDRISLIFADGTFGDLPKGNFRVYYRTSANRSMTITPGSMIGISFELPYISATGASHTLTFNCELKYTVSNSSRSETNQSIKQNAPATYYTQNRMVTGEDYNIAPLTVSQEIIKTKSINRTTSGISRYFDLIDSTGKYSKTNLYGSDGVLYRDIFTKKTAFSFNTQSDIEGAIYNTIEPILKQRNVLNYYLNKFPRVLVSDLQASWIQSTSDTNRSTGTLVDTDGDSYTVGSFTATNLKYIEAGALMKFVSPGYNVNSPDTSTDHFNSKGEVVIGPVTNVGDSYYKWVKVIRVTGNGTQVQDTGLGPIIVNDIIPTGAKLTEIRQKFATSILNDVKTQIIDQAFAYKRFGLRYDDKVRQWKLITNSNINTTDEFSVGKAGNNSNQNLDASWILLFETNGETYTVTYRGLRYIFESDKELKFYFDSSDKVYDSKSGTIVKDKISVLGINRRPGDKLYPFTNDYDWEIIAEYRDADGYIDSKKIEVGFYDQDDDGVVDNPQLFLDIVDPDNLPTISDKYIFLKKYITSSNTEDFKYIDNAYVGQTRPVEVVRTETDIVSSKFLDGQVFYIEDVDAFKVNVLADATYTLTSDYKAYIGRDKLKFQYIHNSDENNRIDPSASNIIDTYLLTKTYDTRIRQWIDDAISSRPLPPSSDELYRSFGLELNKIKTVSDEIIYHPAKYRILFGSKANLELQATFKIVKNKDLVTNDNDIKSRVAGLIKSFFAIENWDFGDTFYFTELVAYVMKNMAPDITSFIIVPKQQNQTFGSLYQIQAESDELFIADVTVDDCEIIDEITADKIKAAGSIITTSTEASSTAVKSSAYNIISASGGYTFTTNSNSGSFS